MAAAISRLCFGDCAQETLAATGATARRRTSGDTCATPRATSRSGWCTHRHKLQDDQQRGQE